MAIERLNPPSIRASRFAQSGGARWRFRTVIARELISPHHLVEIAVID